MISEKYPFIPTSKKEMEKLGWDCADIILISGDAYIDHPSFGTAVIARVLEREGYRVAVVPQPNWRDDLRDFKKLGAPRLFFGVSAGAMDSMINHYTANKRLRSNDAYTPEGRAGQRPDYALSVYCKIIKSLYPDTPVIAGGIEASLRRFTHYDYWSDSLKRSALIESGADILVYGMGERPMVDIANAIASGEQFYSITRLPQIVYSEPASVLKRLSGSEDTIILNSFETCVKDKMAFVSNFNIIEQESNKIDAKRIAEPSGDRVVIVNPPYPLPSEEEMDSWYDLPFTKLPHPRYKGKHIPAYEMIKFSINTHRGCFGACSFCTISAHQGKFIQSRSVSSIKKEIQGLTKLEGFKGIVSDVGGPTANMYRMRGKDIEMCNKCHRDSCLYPNLCKNLDNSHSMLMDMYKEIESVNGIRRFYIGSGIRYDLFLDSEGFYDMNSKAYFEELVTKHTSGRLKVAPEHTEDHVLKAMGKPSFKSFAVLKREFERVNRDKGLKYQLIPYFISSHPGCKMDDMKRLSDNPELKGILLEQVQDFTPTPMTRSSVSYYSGIDTKTLKSIFVEREQKLKQKQKSFFFNKHQKF